MGNQNNQRIILKKPESQSQEIPESISAIILILITQQTYKFYIDTSLTPTQLKQEIYSKISKSLRPQQMILELNGKYLHPDDKLSSKLTNMDLLIQKKIPLGQISSIQYYSKIQDEITLEKGVVAVPCGHRYGRQALYLLLKYTIDEKQWQIKCTTCFKQIQFAFCSKILALTKEQNEYFAKQLTKNWLQSNSKQCPGCKHSVKNEHNKCNKVKCADDKCKFGYFCFKCLKKWNSNDFKQCGNFQCLLENEMSIEQNSKQITLYDHLQDLSISVKIPKMRFCPKCKIPIEHSIGCKHVTCTKCKVSFCWVCLSIFKRSWNCGAYNEYCGQVVYKTQ